jgi:hypothetical protein
LHWNREIRRGFGEQTNCLNRQLRGRAFWHI